MNLEEIANTIPFMFRLKGVKQAGISSYIKSRDPTPQYDRFEHSVKVAQYTEYFLKSNEVDFSEFYINKCIITALIHDIQHPAFSHVLDQIFDNIQENRRSEIVSSLQFGTFLNNYQLKTEDLLSDGGNPTLNIVKAPWPDINTDRLAYILMDTFTSVSQELELLENMAINENQIIYCKNIETAKILFNKSAELAIRWKNVKNIGEYIVFANILKKAVDLGLLTMDSFYHFTDKEILGILRGHCDEDEHCALSLATNDLLTGKFKFTRVDHTGDNIQSDRSHIRLLDPLVSVDHDFHRLSDLDKTVKNQIENINANFKDINIQIQGCFF